MDIEFNNFKEFDIYDVILFILCILLTMYLILSIFVTTEQTTKILCITNDTIDTFDNVIDVNNVNNVNGSESNGSNNVLLMNSYEFDNKIVQQINDIKKQNDQLRNDVTFLQNVMSKLYTTDSNGDYIVNGWFVQFHNVTTNSPNGTVLTEIIRKVYGVPIICFRSRDRYPFLSTPDKPIFFPKSDYIGFRAMTVLKIPKTGYYDFKVLVDDGMRLYFQKVSSNVILNEKNVRSVWNLAIDSWNTQAEVWIYSPKMYLNENEMIMLRADYFEIERYASFCIRLRYYTDNNSTNFTESNLPIKNMFCSLLWNEVPLLGYS